MQIKLQSLDLSCREFRNIIVSYARKYETCCILDSNRNSIASYQDKYGKYDLLVAYSSKGLPEIKTFKELNKITPRNKAWWFGIATYDLKNNIEDLKSVHPDEIDWPELYFFQPEVLLRIREGILYIDCFIDKPEQIILEELLAEIGIEPIGFQTIDLIPRISKMEYIEKVKSIQHHILKGNIYEMNFCQEFFQHKEIDPYEFFNYLNELSPSPFAAFFKTSNRFLLSASPERFLQKSGSHLISQPIKGTATRDSNYEQDKLIAGELASNPKERSENIMIVDIVRNDLSRIAKKHSVKVEELCKIYSFPHVHQMISTITAEIPEKNLLEILKATFPMGSMTGAPKVEAMKIAEEFETTRRGLYSGSVGYVDPEMNFDFNVVIRSLQYNAEKHYLSYMTGSAITALSDPEREYEECLLKAYGLISKELTYDISGA